MTVSWDVAFHSLVEKKASNTPTIRARFPRAVTSAHSRSNFKFPFLFRFAPRMAAFNSPRKMKMEAIK